MTSPRTVVSVPGDHLDAMNDLRVKQNVAAVLELADDAWRSWMTGQVTDPLGMAWVPRSKSPSLLRSRQMTHRPSSGEHGPRAARLNRRNFNTLGMLLIPHMAESSR